MLSYGLDRSIQTIQMALMLGIFMLVVVLACALAGGLCRCRYRPVRFMLLLAAGMVALSAVGMSLMFVVSCLVTGLWPSRPILILLQLGGVGMICGACIFLISLPFVLVGLNSPLFRPRLFACLRLGPASRRPDGTAVLPQDDTGGFGLTDSHSI